MGKSILYIIILSFIISCGEKRKEPPVDLRRGMDKEIQVNESVYTVNDSRINPVRYYPQTDKEEWNEATNPINGNNIIKTKKFYYDFLNEFCKKYYSRKFKGTTYVYGSISIERVTKEDENTVEVKGTHSFKGIIKSFDQREFVATIRNYNNNKYNVLFRRRGWVTGQWKDTGNIMFTYNPEE